MLFNPNWTTTKSDPMKLDTLIGWLERQAPNEWYDYRSCTHCLLAQYFREHGYCYVELSKNFVVHRTSLGPQMERLPDFFNWIAEEPPHDIGHALKRAKLARDNPLSATRACFEFNYLRDE